MTNEMQISNLFLFNEELNVVMITSFVHMQKQSERARSVAVLNEWGQGPGDRRQAAGRGRTEGRKGYKIVSLTGRKGKERKGENVCALVSSGLAPGGGGEGQQR